MIAAIGLYGRGQQQRAGLKADLFVKAERRGIGQGDPSADLGGAGGHQPIAGGAHETAGSAQTPMARRHPKGTDIAARGGLGAPISADHADGSIGIF